MEYYVPEPVNHDFRNAMISFLLVMALSVGVGIFAGYGAKLFLGNDEEVMLTYTYTERMAAVKTVFAADNYACQLVAGQLSRRPGVRILRAADGSPVVVDPSGARYTPEEYFTAVSPVEEETGRTVAVTVDDDGNETYTDLGTGDDTVTLTAADVIDAVAQIFSGAEAALADYEDSAGDAVEDVRLWNAAAADDGTVYFYYYYDYAGFIAVAYDPTDTFSERPEPIRMLSSWYLDYSYEPER